MKNRRTIFTVVIIVLVPIIGFAAYILFRYFPDFLAPSRYTGTIDRNCTVDADCITANPLRCPYCDWSKDISVARATAQKIELWKEQAPPCSLGVSCIAPYVSKTSACVNRQCVINKDVACERACREAVTVSSQLVEASLQNEGYSLEQCGCPPR